MFVRRLIFLGIILLILSLAVIPASASDLGILIIYKYHDLNQNNLMDNGEALLSGWVFDLYKDGNLIASGTTDTNGFLAFSGLSAGNYTVCEAQQVGWINTGSLSASGCVTVMVDAPMPGANTVAIPLNDNKNTSIEIDFMSHVNNTWTYQVSELTGRDLGYWMADLGSCLGHLISSSPPAIVETGKNAPMFGLKWEVDEEFTSGQFSFTLDADYPADVMQVLVKAGNKTNTGEILGPICDTFAPTILYVGNYQLPQILVTVENIDATLDYYYEWSLDKSADSASVVVPATVHYTINVTRSASASTAYMHANYDICVTNNTGAAIPVGYRIGATTYVNGVSYGGGGQGSSSALNMGKTCFPFGSGISANQAWGSSTSFAFEGFFDFDSSDPVDFTGEMTAFTPIIDPIPQNATETVVDSLYCPPGFSCTNSSPGSWTVSGNDTLNYEVAIVASGACPASGTLSNQVHIFGTLHNAMGATNVDLTCP